MLYQKQYIGKRVIVECNSHSGLYLMAGFHFVSEINFFFLLESGNDMKEVAQIFY